MSHDDRNRRGDTDMTDLDRYTEKAARAVLHHDDRCEAELISPHGWTPCGCGERIARAALAAVYDDIRADVAEEIAGAIEEPMRQRDAKGFSAAGDSYAHAVRIAQEHATSHTSAAETPAGGDVGTAKGSEKSGPQIGAQRAVVVIELAAAPDLREVARVVRDANVPHIAGLHMAIREDAARVLSVLDGSEPKPVCPPGQCAGLDEFREGK